MQVHGVVSFLFSRVKPMVDVLVRPSESVYTKCTHRLQSDEYYDFAASSKAVPDSTALTRAHQ